jgi:hypothetical protein
MVQMNISFEADAESAQRFAELSEQEKRKLRLLLRLYLRECDCAASQPYGIMDEIGRQAEANGLDEATLQAILSDRSTEK